jgi:hypothetical protein
LPRVNLEDANLSRANLEDAHNLTQDQLDAAMGNDRTALPDEGITRPTHWSKAERPESPSAAQPDDAERAPPATGAPGPDK